MHTGTVNADYNLSVVLQFWLQFAAQTNLKKVVTLTLVFPDNSGYDNAHLLKSDMSGRKVHKQQLTVNTAQHIPLSGLHPGLWTTSWSLDYILVFDYNLVSEQHPGLWTTTWSLNYNLFSDYNLVSGLHPGLWTTSWSLNYNLVSGLQPSLWTTTCYKAKCL
ncbi:hypothetical protein BsWGS_11816 [Bradybaena similaris]